MMAHIGSEGLSDVQLFMSNDSHYTHIWTRFDSSTVLLAGDGESQDKNSLSVRRAEADGLPSLLIEARAKAATCFLARTNIH